MNEITDASNMETTAAEKLPDAGAAMGAPLYAGDEADSKRQNFESLIRGEYKQAFDERVQKIIDKRFRDMRLMKENAAKTKPVMDALSEKYGEKDAEKLLKMIKGDTDSSIHSDRHARALKTVMKWKTDADALKKMNPAFNLAGEMQNRAFTSLLRAGVDVKTAYNALHQDEILEKAVLYAAGKARDKTIKNMRMHASRPEENGFGGRGGARMSPVNVMNMTRQEREEIERRCARGEKVYFS